MCRKESVPKSKSFRMRGARCYTEAQLMDRCTVDFIEKARIRFDGDILQFHSENFESD